MLNFLAFIHAALVLMAIGSGAIVMFGLITGSLLDKWAILFLRFSLAASVTGILFPSHHFQQTHWVSILSVYVTGAVILAWRKHHLSGIWRSIFAIATTMVLYLNVIVAVTMIFKHISRFKVPVPTQFEPVFLVTQFLVVAVFVLLGVRAVRRFHSNPTHSF